MSVRLVLGIALSAAAGFELARGASNLPIAIAGAIVGVLLLITAGLDALGRGPGRGWTAP
jgi:hypothetical protein